ncbi:N-acetyltransferase family protein [Nocardia brasiliensis]|uniref:GNAT family N-acetyltransferase n=1 Tax=Nocardia brasiliensis TaxID=37326 RepID=UPI003D9124C8
MTEIVLRYASEDDLPEVWAMLRRYATSVEAEFTVSMDGLRESLFGPTPAMSTLVAARVYEVCGVATFYPIYSTWRGRRGLHLEDLFVLPAYRRSGVGSLLVGGLAQVALERGHSDLRWTVRHRNAGAVEFCGDLGARYAGHADFYHLSATALVDIAAAARPIEEAR